MKTATARAENVVVLRLATMTKAQEHSQTATNPQTTATDSFFHCKHGRPEHHYCPQCENESQNLPGFFDD